MSVMENRPPEPGHGGKKLCKGTNRSGERCGNAAGFKTDHVGYGNCHLHAGCTRTGKKAAQREMALEVMTSLRETWEGDPLDALDELMRRAMRGANFLLDRLLEQESVLDGDKRHVLWSMWVDQLDLAGDLAAKAAKAGLAERETRLNEQLGQLLATAVLWLLETPEMGLTAEQRQTGRRLAGAKLRELTNGGAS